MSTRFLIVRVCAAACFSLMLCGQILIPNTKKYENIDYQFSVEIPRGLRGCMTSAPNPNHGVWLPLDGAPCSAADDQRPYISVNANYNTAEIGNTPQAIAAAECRWRKARQIVWLGDERIGDRKAAGCRRSFADGHIEVSYIVLRKTGDNPLAWIEVGADLVTTPTRYAADRRVFRRVLRGIRVHPDGPED